MVDTSDTNAQTVENCFNQKKTRYGLREKLRNLRSMINNMKIIMCKSHPDFSVAAIKKNIGIVLLHLSFAHFANDNPKEIFRVVE